jgi:hypothetical protein
MTVIPFFVHMFEVFLASCFSSRNSAKMVMPVLDANVYMSSDDWAVSYEADGMT